MLSFLSGSLRAEIDLAKLPPPAQRPVDYDKDIQPIFSASCYGCHGKKTQENDYRLDVKSIALLGGQSRTNIVIGKSEESRLIHYVSGLVEGKLMPQKGERLSSEQIGLLRAWIDQGAHWPDDGNEPKIPSKMDHWAFQTPKRSELPEVKNKKWARNEIDLYILAKREAQKISPSREADRVTLIRRVSFDVTGLPPTPEEVKRFVSDRSPHAYEELVGRLLASPRFGERWARHWLDVVRFAETTGFEVNTPRDNAWPYRDYVIRAFNEDKPYNRFILEQLAGDAFKEDAATGFLVGGPDDKVKSPDIQLTKQQRADELADMVSVTGSAFLGLTVGCARCHNHKFDPILQTDYYSMAAVFAGVQHGERELKPADYEARQKESKEIRAKLSAMEKRIETFEQAAHHIVSLDVNVPQKRAPVHPKKNVDRFTPVKAKFVRFTVLATSTIEPCIDELEIFTAEEKPRNVALASVGAKATASGTFPNSDIHKLEHINDGKYGNSRSWISDERGKGWVQIELPEIASIEKVVWARDREEKFADRLPTQYRIEVATDTNNWTLVATEKDRRPYVTEAKPEPNYSVENLPKEDAEELKNLLAEQGRLEPRFKELTTYPMVYAGIFLQPPEKIHRLQRGDVMQPKEEMLPGAITSLGKPLDVNADTPEWKRRIALARWIGSPENPLTARVMVNRLWHYYFGRGLVATPSDFGINGAKPTHPELLDWLATELVARKWKLKDIHRLILLSSTYRQSSEGNSQALAIDAGSTLLWRFPPRRLEAEPIRDAILAVSGKLDFKMGGPGYQVFEPNDNYVRVYTPRKEFGPTEWRRMIYQTKPRMQQDETFGGFDCPDAGQTAPSRGRSTTALQALNLLNSRFMLQQSEFFAERIREEAGKSESEQAKLAFQLAFNRKPEGKELTASVKLIKEQGLTIFCRALYNANEFLYVF